MCFDLHALCSFLLVNTGIAEYCQGISPAVCTVFASLHHCVMPALIRIACLLVGRPAFCSAPGHLKHGTNQFWYACMTANSHTPVLVFLSVATFRTCSESAEIFSSVPCSIFACLASSGARSSPVGVDCR